MLPCFSVPVTIYVLNVTVIKEKNKSSLSEHDGKDLRKNRMTLFVKDSFERTRVANHICGTPVHKKYLRKKSRHPYFI
jgi:hypothetical protein